MRRPHIGMAEGTNNDSRAGRRQIVERHRLTHILDQTQAQVVAVVAPAGYGKTTLIRQWLSNPSRKHAWLTASAVSADVAALAADFSLAASQIVDSAHEGLLERLRVTASPDREVPALASLLSQSLQSWPSDAWFALDDYHLVGEASHAEEFLERVVRSSGMRMIIGSRRRPRWVSARDLLYGDAVLIDQHALAMTDDEASELLPAEFGWREELLGQAKGWPAVISLASLVSSPSFPEASLPEALHDFFAEELFETADPEMREALLALAVIPTLHPDVAAGVFGPDEAETTLTSAVSLGFLTRVNNELDLHPLLRQFLKEKLFARGQVELDAIVCRVGAALIDLRRWDDTIAVAEEFEQTQLLEPALESSFDQMLRDGRISSLVRWLDLADRLGLASPALDVAASEVALRRGLRPRAEAFALAALKSATDQTVTVRALIVAGKAAYFDDRYEEALEYFQRASCEARNPSETRETLWGLFICLNQLDREDATRILGEYVQHGRGEIDAELRAATGFCMSVDRDGVGSALQEADRAMHLIGRSRDPMIRASFLNAYGRALAEAGRYGEAAAIAEVEREEADRFRLDFADAGVHCTEAMALLGLREFDRARNALVHASSEASRLGDLHNQVDAAAIQCRLLLATSRPDEALAVVAPRWTRLPSPVMWSELTACRALALACLGDHAAALAAADQADACSLAWYPRVTARCARAVSGLQAGFWTQRATSFSRLSTALFRAESLILSSVRIVACLHYLASLLRALPRFDTSSSETRERLRTRASNWIRD